MYTKRLTLAAQTIEIDHEFDFEIVGITSQEKDYRLVWSLNLQLGWNFERDFDHAVFTKQGDSIHSRFTYTEDDGMIIFTLLSNKGSDGFLLPEFSRFDYIMIIDGASQFRLEELLREARKAKFVLAALSLETMKMKSKYNLIID
jgi:hypothetical protein